MSSSESILRAGKGVERFLGDWVASGPYKGELFEYLSHSHLYNPIYRQDPVGVLSWWFEIFGRYPAFFKYFYYIDYNSDFLSSASWFRCPRSCPSRLKAYNADEVLETVDKYKGDEVDTKKARPCSNVDDNIPLLVQSSAAITEP